MWDGLRPANTLARQFCQNPFVTILGFFVMSNISKTREVKC